MTTLRERLAELGDGADVRLSGVAVAKGDPLRGPCTGRPCVALQANIAMNTPRGPDVIVHVQVADFWLTGDTADDRVLVRPKRGSVTLRLGMSGSVFWEDEIWHFFSGQVRARAGVATNWFEEILPTDATVVVKARLDWEIDAASTGAAGYRTPPRMPVLSARKIY